MKKLLVALTTLTLVFGTVHAASFHAQDGSLQIALTDWHSTGEAPYTASYTHSSLSEVVDGYWQALHDLGYTGTLQGASASSTTYVFEGSQRTLEATFTLSGEQVIATINRSESYA